MLALVAPGPPTQLALRFGHKRRTAFLPAGDEADVFAVFMKTIQHCKIAFTRHTKASVYALGDQRLHQRVAGHAWRGG
jgi:hypothetical protein